MDHSVTNILERKLPCSLDAEQRLLGAILINPELMNNVTEFLRDKHFYDNFHGKIYHAIEVIVEKGLTPTPTAIQSMLDKEPLFHQYGGADFLGKLCTKAIMIINVLDYAKIIYDLALKRDLIQIGESVVNTAYGSSLADSAPDQIERAEQKLYDLATEGLNDKSFVRIFDPIQESLASINRAMKSPDHVIGISTGLEELDKKLSGFHNSDLVIVAGRPSMGKTAFALNLAISACKSLKARNKDNSSLAPSVGFFSLEMSSEQLAHRLLSMYSQIDSSNLRSGKLNELEYDRLKKASTEITDLQFFIDDTPALSISAIRTRARKLKRKHNLAILFIDYLQLIRGSNKSENRVVEVSEVTQGLKAIAKELNIPVIALAQLSREVEKREDKKPMLSDLRESGSIEQDADLVMFIYREEYYLARQMPSPSDTKHSEKQEEWQARMEKARNKAEIMVAKHRNGEIGKVDLYYDVKHSKFGNMNVAQNILNSSK